MPNAIIYDDLNSADYGVYITNAGAYKKPVKKYKKYSVPGRNGDLYVEEDAYKNVEIRYPLVAYDDFENKFDSFAAALLRKKGYLRLEDTIHPDCFRLAEYTDGFDPDQVTTDGMMASGEIIFDCKPQLYLKSGEEPLQFMVVMIDQDEIEEEGETYIRESYQTGRYKLGTSKAYTIKVHTKNGATANLIVVGSYDDNPSPFSYFRTMDNVVDGGTMTDTITDGVTDSLEFAFFADDNHALDDIWLEISMTILVDGVDMPINAIMAKKWTITNPTGFASKPLFEYFFVTDTAIKITNIVDGVEEEYFNVSSSNSAVMPCVYMDCDSQYMYDKDGNNLSQTLTITTAQDAKGRNLVFPRFGTDDILIEMGVGSHDTLGILNIYPRWWKV